VCGALPLIDMITPEKGSPDLNVASNMSPTLARSSLDGSNSLARAPVGSRIASCCLSTTDTGSLQASSSDGRGWCMAIFRLPISRQTTFCLFNDLCNTFVRSQSLGKLRPILLRKVGWEVELLHRPSLHRDQAPPDLTLWLNV